jgi:hypothetical protein
MSFTKNVVTGSSADGDYIYYNATVINNNVRTDLSVDDPSVYFQDTRVRPIIQDTSKYVVSVDNFTINGGSKNLPLFIPQIVVGPDINLTIYSVSFGWQGRGTAGTSTNTQYIQATIPITWIPEDQAGFTVVPRTATPRQLEATTYYYCYTYDHWVALFNNALTTAWRDVRERALDLGLTFGTLCPYLSFNPTTGLFSLNQDAQTAWLPFGTVARTNTQVQSASAGVSDPLAPYTPFGPSTASGYGAGESSYVGWNTNMDLLISNLDTVYFGGTSVPVPGASTANSHSYVANSSTILTPDAVSWGTGTTVTYPENVVNVIPYQDANGSNVFTLTAPYATPTTAATPTYITSSQDFISTGGMWSPIASIVLTTNTIPLRFEANANPVNIGASNQGGQTQASGASQKVLLETPIDAVTADIWKGFIQYKPLTPIFSALDPCQDGLTNLDVGFFWRNRLTNTLVPIQNVNGGSVSFRLRFVKK